MVLAQIIGYPLLPIAALELFLGALLLKQNPRNSSVNRSVALFAFFAAAFTLSSALMYVRASLGLDYQWFARGSWIGWLTIPAAIQSVFYLENEKSEKARRIGLLLYPFWIIVFLVVLFTDLVVTDQYRLFPFLNLHGPLENPLRLAGGALILWLLYEVLRLRKRMIGIRRSQLNYFFYGTIIFGAGGSLVAGFIPLLGKGGIEPGLAAYFSFPWVLLTFYAITRYRLFDIRIVISRFLNVLLLSLVISSLHFLLFKALEPSVGVVASIFTSIPIIGFIFFGTPLSKLLQRWINDRVLGERFAYQQMIKESANAAISILHLDELLHFITDTVRGGMKVDRACLFLRDHDGRYVARQCFRSIESPRENLLLPVSVLSRLVTERRTLLRDELDSSERAEDRDLGAALQELGAELLVPFISKGEMLGALSLSERTTGEAYLGSDIEVLQTLAGHAAIAIENARLFEEAGRIRASLREQEGIFRALAQTLPAAIFIHRGGRFLYANPAGMQMTGYSMDEILNMDFWSMTHPDYRDLIVNRGRARLEGEGPPSQYEFKILRKDGTERWVLMTAGTIEYEGKGAIIGTIFDITKRREAEDALRESEENFRALAETMEAAVLIHAGGRFLYTNPAAIRLTGYSEQDLLQTDFWALAHPDYHDLLLQRGKARIEGANPPRQYEFKVIRKDGVERWALASVGRITYDGQAAVIATLLDITELKDAEEALRESEERFRQVSETAREWIWEVDATGRFTYSSPVVKEILGYHPGEIVGKKYFFDFFDPDERDRLKSAALSVFARKEPFIDFLNLNRHREGKEVFLSTSGLPLVDRLGDLVGYRGVDVDITERIRAEQERLQLYDDSVRHYQALLEEQHRHQAEKESILKDLHDGIGGLTTNINLLAELAQKSHDIAEIKRSLATIAELSRESLSEIRSFIQSLDARELSWPAIAAEFRHLGSTIIEAHGLRFSIETTIPEQTETPSSTVAMNLFRIYKESLSNVIKHARATEVSVSFVAEGEKLVLSVRDNGIGMNGRRKSGRGLMNMRTRTEEIGGRFSISSESEVGTKVIVEMPIP